MIMYMVRLEGKSAIKMAERGRRYHSVVRVDTGCGTKLVVIVGLWEKVTPEEAQVGERVSQPGFGSGTMQTQLEQRP